MRKELVFTVQNEGRDKGKSFVLREMPARQAEKWATRAFLAIAQADVTLPDGVVSAGFGALSGADILRMLAALKWEQAEPLLDELLSCVSARPDPNNPAVEHKLIDGVIEEPSTYFLLRAEVMKLHLGFLQAGSPSISVSQTPA